jgi:hypothetical protein
MDSLFPDLEPARLPHGTNCCDARWNGYNTVHCSVCHNTFVDIDSSDIHRPNAKCLPPNMVGLRLTERSYPCWEKE